MIYKFKYGKTIRRKENSPKVPHFIEHIPIQQAKIPRKNCVHPENSDLLFSEIIFGEIIIRYKAEIIKRETFNTY